MRDARWLGLFTCVCLALLTPSCLLNGDVIGGGGATEPEPDAYPAATVGDGDEEGDGGACTGGACASDGGDGDGDGDGDAPPPPVCSESCGDAETCCHWGCDGDTACVELALGESCPSAWCGPLTDGFETLLSETESCGDLEIVVYDAAETVMVNVLASRVGRDAWDEGLSDATVTYTLPDEDILVVARTGGRVATNWCSDVVVPSISTELYAHQVAGTVTLRVYDLQDDGWSGRADMTLEAVKLASDDGEQANIEHFEVLGVDF